MGCCLSSGKFAASRLKLDQHSPAGARPSPAIADNGNREPPSSMEEETVKEVLSETPASKPAPLCNHSPIGNLIDDEKEIQKTVRGFPPNFVAEQVLEVSEISSLSESLSNTTYTDKMDDGEEVHQRVRRLSPAKLRSNRSFSGDVVPKREMLHNRVQNWRPDQSPGRRNGALGSARLVQSREISQRTVTRGVRTELLRRDLGEKSSRRSRSPAIARPDGGTSGSALGRTPSVRKSGNSPGRVRMAPNESPKKVPEEPKLIPQSESLENPLVSLECFIFL